ncbi:hypothetical protein [Ancylomarina sp. 16SWW S1-10-2]|uniref:hypothetical protein n=1 Tax=Ancylomarina sp. 16SWW S1-10-2 TaxID=2499681 RepID=UPI0012AE3B94|nr:hypothetical protein [Ancylomarina sp. 16SWW S1-10-2]MRT92830.1 hypothetical protein [Ancylomarina sp. 16SWW S1-10-2]
MKFIIIFITVFEIFSISGYSQNQAYSNYLLKLDKSRIEFSVKYANAKNKDSVIKEAKEFLFRSYQSIFEYWYGTKWDFNGTTRIPGQGRIACGYFVTNTLVDLGFNIPRIKWAQAASEVFITKLVDRKDIKRFSNQNVSDVRKYLLLGGKGIYLVGLDQHVGFVLVDSN